MTKIALIACSKTKSSQPSPAAELYCSPLFKKSLAYARSLNPDKIFILSALHGVIELSEMVAPYDESLLTSTPNKLKQWATKVTAQLEAKSDLKNDEFIFLAGKRYYENLIPQISHYTLPLEGLGLGERLSFLTKGL